jgi:hypothetical protein
MGAAMVEYLGHALDVIGGFASTFANLDFEVAQRLIGGLVVVVGAIVSIAAIRRNQQFERLKWSGVPRTAALTLQSSLLVVVLLGAGLGLIGALKGDVPEWASTGIPGVVAIMALLLLLHEVVFRSTFTLERFWNYAIFPMLVPLLALAAFSLPALSAMVQGLMGGP